MADTSKQPAPDPGTGTGKKPKQLQYDEEAREAVRRGVAKLARAVKATLGPKGRNVILDKTFGSPTVTKDGVTVSREIELEDPYENMGARMVREVASKTSEAAGDGTSTATVLAEVLFNEGLRAAGSGANPMLLKRGMERAAEDVIAGLRAMAREVQTLKDLENVAILAANGDRAIARVVAEAAARGGTGGVVTVEEGKTTDVSIEHVAGMRFERGYTSPYFITNPETMECELEDPYILVHEKKIAAAGDVVPVLELVLREGRALLVIAEEVEGEALAILVINKLRNPALRCAAVKAPGYGDRRKALLGDIAAVTGARFLDEGAGVPLAKVQASDFGRARKVKIDKDSTTVIEGVGPRERIEARVRAIQEELARNTGEYDREKLSERLAGLSGGVTVIRVGAATESEIKEKKARVEDALHAVGAARDEGIVPGGGVALLRAAAGLTAPPQLGADEQTGYDIAVRACRTPLTLIAENAGQDGARVVDRVLASRDANYGYDARGDRYGDMVQVGIIDPVKVVRSALQNAVAVATLLLTSETMVAEVPARVEVRAPARVEVRAPAAVPTRALPALRGEVIAIEKSEALCWVEVAGGRRVKTRVPLARLAPLDVRPGLRFERRAGDAPARVAVPDEAPELPVPSRDELLAEVERLQEEYERDLRQRRLFTRDRRAPE